MGKKRAQTTRSDKREKTTDLEKYQRCTYYLKPETVRILKAYATLRGITLATLVREATEEFVQENIPADIRKLMTKPSE